MRIRHKILLGYLAIVTVTVVLVAVFLFTLSNVSRSYSDLLNRDQKVLLQANNLLAAVQRQMVAARTYELLKDPDLLADYNQAIEAQQQAIAQINPLLTQEEDRRAIQSIQSARQHYTQLAQHAIDLALAGRQNELIELRRSQGEPARQTLVAECDAFIQKKSSEVAASQT